MLLAHLEANNLKLPYLKKVVIGGSACPRAMTQKFQDVYGVEVIHAWGMTEMSPLGTLGSLKPEYAGLKGEARLDVQQKQGHPPFGVEMKITDDAGKPMPWDGKTFGRLKVRGPSVARRYFKDDADDSRRRRLFRHRRRRHARPLRLYQHHRPLQGRDQVGRRVDFLDRNGKPRGRPSQGRRSRGDRRAPSEMGRAAAACRRAQGRPDARPRTSCWHSSTARSPIGGCRTTSSSSREIPHTATGKILKMALRDQFKDYAFPTAAA